jgi:hypothetical protein
VASSLAVAESTVHLNLSHWVDSREVLALNRTEAGNLAVEPRLEASLVSVHQAMMKMC